VDGGFDNRDYAKKGIQNKEIKRKGEETHRWLGWGGSHIASLLAFGQDGS
jgi:hypothetical protein